MSAAVADDRVSAAVERALARAPRLTAEQRDRLASLLRPALNGASR